MDNVSRPLIALLLGTVAFFALWITMLKPSPHSGGKQGLGQYQSAINRAKQAVATSNKAGVAHGGTVVTTPATAPKTPSATSTASRKTKAVSTTSSQLLNSAAGAARGARAAQHRQAMVVRALSSHRVLALLFFNPAAADDQAVKQELAAVPVRGGKVVKLAIPLNELSRYGVVTNQVQVNESPTLVIVDGHAQAGTITGFTDRFEIAQRIDDALAAR